MTPNCFQYFSLNYVKHGDLIIGSCAHIYFQFVYLIVRLQSEKNLQVNVLLYDWN